MLWSGFKYSCNIIKNKHSNRVVSSVALMFCLLITITFPAGAQYVQTGAIEIEKGGKLWIEGSASIVDYTCKAEELSGNGSIENTQDPQQNVRGEGDVFVKVSVPVHSLECGKKKMNRDMYEALKADQYSHIYYKLLDAVIADSTTAPSQEGDSSWMNIKTTGVLEIAGVKDTTRVFVEGNLLSEDRFRVRGKKQVSMKTFDITPPTALLGLIKAKSELTVHFDVTVRLKKDTP